MNDAWLEPKGNGSHRSSDKDRAPATGADDGPITPQSGNEPDDRVNILLVDDRPEQLLVLETILAGLGQNLIRAGSGREALRFLLNDACALILLDVNMPDLDGFETAALIRQRPRTRQTPIIFITAGDETETHVSRGYSLGAVDYILTPVVAEVLAAKVSVFVELARSTRRVQKEAAHLEQRVQERTEELRSVNAALQAEIIERERAATERDRLLADAQEGVRRRDELLATLAHELRNPLAAIANGAELLGCLGVTNPEFQNVREIIDRQARHMTLLLQDLLDVARLTRGKIELRKQTVDVCHLVSEALEAKRGEFGVTGHQVELSLPDESLAILADATRLLQVFDNLLGNAAKYTPAGGRIFIEVRPDAGQAEIRIRDSGIGIAPDNLSRIFDPFVQLNQSHVRPSEGLGIGLTLVRRLVELHGGRVSATSAGLGQGTEFIMQFPLVVNSSLDGFAEQQLPVTIDADAPKATRRIVLVEDNRDARRLLSKLLSRSGHSVEEAEDGPSGVDFIRRFRPDLAFVDIGLPGCDGYQVAARVRADPECCDVRLIAMTGYGQPEDCRRALAAGFDAHLVKPVRINELTRILESEPATA